MTTVLLQYLARHVRGRSSLKFGMSLVGILMSLLSSTMTAQDFVNSGPVNNTGTIRLKNGVSGVPSPLAGTFELFGTNQTLPAAQYTNVKLTGSGTTTTTGGNLSVNGNLTIASPVTLNITKGSVLTLGDTLFESGVLTGAIQKSVNLSGGTTSSSFGNIGAAISWTGTAPGVTTVMRVSDSTVAGSGNQSIQRIYTITPTVSTATGTVSLNYSAADLNGYSPDILELWRSEDNGSTWLYEGGTVDTSAKTVTETNATLNGLWTASDTLHRLGLPFKQGTPTTILATSGNNQTKPILTQVDSLFTVTVVDVNGNPVAGVLVQFSLIKPDSMAYGDTLSVSSALTDASGHASTLLTLGSKVGIYTVTASYGALTPVQFSAIAVHGPVSSIARSLGNAQSKQILTKLDTAFTVTVTDVGGNPIANASVQFSITSAPTNASGQSLTATSAVTDALGKASTILTLGDKVGTYKVKGVVSGVADSVIFNATASSGAPAQFAAVSAVIDSAQNGTTLASPFIVSVADAGGNPVQGESVHFGITSVPDPATPGLLSDTVATTNSSGQASTVLTLGARTGNYIVQARSSSLGTALVFTAKAIPGPVAVMNASSGNNQSEQISTTLADYIVNVADQNGNPVPNTAVTFAIDSIPANATGASLSVTTAATNASGAAATRLTLGNKVGVYRVRAAVNGIDTLFTSLAKPGPAVAMSAVSGSGQSGVILTTPANDLTVHLVDMGGNSTPNTSVQFFVSSTPDSAQFFALQDSIVTTDSLGVAQTAFRLGDKAGVYHITARSAGVPDTSFAVTAIPGTVVAMKSISQTTQSDSVFATLNPFVVRVADIGNNGVPGATVMFTLSPPPTGSVGASLSDTTVVSDASGNASTSLTLGSKVGTYTVTAIVSTPSASESQAHKSMRSFAASGKDISIVFTVNATNASAASFVRVLGDMQTRPTASTLDTAFILHVNDAGGNAVPKQPVTFSVTSAPAEAMGQQVRDTVVSTDSLGVAATLFTLGDEEGIYVVTASTPSLPPVTFTTNGYYVYGDPNNDIDINIADITTLIDHIAGRRKYSKPDSIKSDLNKDGRIDTSDVGFLRDSIFARQLTFDSAVVPVVTAKIEGPQTDPNNPSEQYFPDASTQLEITPQGLRLNLSNTVPVKGIELRIKLKDSVTVQKINYLFARADKMQAIIHTMNNEIIVLAYSLQNAEIQPGDGSILRLPYITSLDQIDTSKVILATMSNVAVKSQVTTTVAPPNRYPTTFSLDQNYPNPFNNSTVIEYSIPDIKTSETKVVIDIFNILGQRVKKLVYGEHDPGHYKVVWDGLNDYGARVSSGVYFCRMIAKNLAITKKMLYVK